jgi:hypothetical protein
MTRSRKHPLCFSRMAATFGPAVAVLALILLWTGAAPAAFAQHFGRNKVQYDTFDFRVLTTEHFDIHYYPEAEQGVRDAARMAERWYTRLSAALGHNFRERRAIIFYADEADFRQTNVIGGMIGEGVQGVTEGFRLRVVMPLTGSYADTDHVLGHELVHQFQYDMSQRAGVMGNFIRLPLWLIEGMAEYFSLGRADAHTAMWLRDAVIREAFPTLDQLSRDPRYFPYRYGQAFWAYVGGTFGDEAAVQLFRAAMAMPLDSAVVTVTGLSSDSLAARWEREVAETYLPFIRGKQAPPYRGRDLAGTTPERLAELGLTPLAGTRILARDIDAGDQNFSPQLSPDGRYVAFLSERDLFGIDLFLADAQTGQVIRRLQSVGTDPHLDAIRFVDSAGTWSPDGQRFAFVTFAQGDNEIAILDVASGEIIQRIQVTGVGSIKDPDWSPDGRQIAFNGISGGISNLYLVDVATGQARQLTSDRHADMQPTWSPDGRQIVFASDRGAATSFERMTFSPPKLSIFDFEQNAVEVLEVFPGSKHINPQFSPDGESVYFVSDRNGISNIYRLHRPTGDVYQVTDVATGVSGLTAVSPSITVARQSGTLMYSVFEAQAYNVYSLPIDETQGRVLRRGAGPDSPLAEERTPSVTRATDPVPAADPAPAPTLAPADTVVAAPDAAVPPVDPALAPADTLAAAPDEVVPPAEPELAPPITAAPLAMADTTVLGLLPPVGAVERTRVDRYLAAAEVGLPASAEHYPDRPYRPRLALDYITQPTAGIGYDPFMGFGVGGGIAMRFSDMLGDNILGVVVQANGTLMDIGGQAMYLNQRRRLNWGATVGHIPYLQVYFTNPASGIYRVLQRTFMTQAAGIGAYPLSQTRRFEANAGIRRIAYGFEADLIVGPNSIQRQRLDRDQAAALFGFADPSALDPMYLFDIGTAYVGDYSFFGFTSPVRGGRYRFGVDGTLGSFQFATATADYRRYFYWPDANLTFAVRGLHFGRYGPDAESGRLFPLFVGQGPLVRGYALTSYDMLTQEQAQETLNTLYGSRIGVANAEIRFPLFGTREFGLINFPYLPTEAVLFADAGMAWGRVGDTFANQQVGRSFSEQTPIFSAGAAARVNLLGALVLEFYYAAAFSRADDRVGVFGINFQPGW